MVHSHTVHLPLGALLIWCTMCGTGEPGSLFSFTLRLVAAPPDGGWRQGGRLRVRVDHACGAALGVALNGQPLGAAASISPLFPMGVQATASAYPDKLWHAWDVPAALPARGNNSVAVTAKGASCNVSITHIDLSLPVSG